LLNQQQKLKDDEANIIVQIDNEKGNQKILKTSMDSSKETMDQLLELHRLALEKNVKPTLDQKDLWLARHYIWPTRNSFNRQMIRSLS